MSAYTVEEGSGAAEVCVLSSPELDRAVMVEVTTEDNSANSELYTPCPIFSVSHCYDTCI